MAFAPHTTALVWPQRQLSPARAIADVEAFSRSGGPSLTNLNPAVRTDRGKWSVELQNIALVTAEKRRVFDAIATHLSGRSGLIAAPVFSFDANPFVTGDGRGIERRTRYSDGTAFSDGTTFAQRQIIAKASAVASISATTIQINAINVADDLSGVRFSYQHAAYKTGPAIAKSGALWTVPVTPAIRMTIPAGAELNFDNPTCLCRLREDGGLRRGFDSVGHDFVSVMFEEASDYWSNLALGLV